MDFGETVQRLVEAAGDPVRLALVAADSAVAARPESERDYLREALEAAAIPHWFDLNMLARLLATSGEGVNHVFLSLGSLPMIERFAARDRAGALAFAVHETTRLGLRKRLSGEDRVKFVVLSARAADAVEATTGFAPAFLRIERVYHRLVETPAALDELEALEREWARAGRIAEEQALAGAVEELRASRLLDPVAQAVTSEFVGWVGRTRGDPTATIALARDALNTYRTLGDERRLARALTLLGGALLDSGAEDDARSVLEEALRLRQRLVDFAGTPTPVTAETYRDLAVTLNLLGDLHSVAGSRDRARQVYEQALDIARRLEGIGPESVQWQRNLGVSLNKLGDLDAIAGRVEDARRQYHEAASVAQRLAARDPENTRWQRDVALSLRRLGDLEASEGETVRAEAAYLESLHRTRNLATTEPGNARWEDDVGILQARLGELSARAGSLDEARAWLEAAVAVWERLEVRDPQRVRLRDKLEQARARLTAWRSA